MTRGRTAVKQNTKRETPLETYSHYLAGILGEFNQDIGGIKAIRTEVTIPEAEELVYGYLWPGREELQNIYRFDAKKFSEMLPQFIRRVVAYGTPDNPAPSLACYDGPQTEIPFFVAGAIDKVKFYEIFYGTPMNNHYDFRTSFWIPRQSESQKIRLRAGSLDEEITLGGLKELFQSYTERELRILQTGLPLFMKGANS